MFYASNPLWITLVIYWELKYFHHFSNSFHIHWEFKTLNTPLLPLHIIIFSSYSPPPLLRDMLGGWGICICIVFDDENGQFILIIFWIRWTVKRQPRWSSSINNQQITSVLSRELHAVTLRKIFIHRGVIIIVVSYKYSRIVSIVACSDLQWF